MIIVVHKPTTQRLTAEKTLSKDQYEETLKVDDHPKDENS
jgi:hypothetical protein